LKDQEDEYISRNESIINEWSSYLTSVVVTDWHNHDASPHVILGQFFKRTREMSCCIVLR
jgi:hypothetical protein